MDWRNLAHCRGLDPEAWFPMGEPGSPGYERLAELPRAICAGCPVRANCLAFALDHGCDDGIWGGLDPTERRATDAAA